jgi:hypothetical protein
VLWDVFGIADVSRPALSARARDLLGSQRASAATADVIDVLLGIAESRIVPKITYQICSLSDLKRLYRDQPFDLVYSQAALEHAWKIEDTWDALREVTCRAGWHSHRIDLADHGRRETNFIEMLEWPEWAYQLTMKYVPGAINRWRAADHIRHLRATGFDVVLNDRLRATRLPFGRNALAKQFRNLPEDELLTLAIDIVAIYRG